MHVNDPKRLVVQPLQHMAGEPAQLEPGTPLGSLVMDPAIRNRFRINGTIQHKSDQGMVVAVETAFGNCPKYIAGA